MDETSGAWLAARRAVPAGPAHGRLWQAALMVELFRRGRPEQAEQVRTDEPWLPRWAAGPVPNPGLRHISRLGHQITAVTCASVDGREVARVALQGDSIEEVDLTDGSVRSVRLQDVAAEFHPAAVFATVSGREALVAITGTRLSVWAADTGALLLATDPDDVPLRAGPLVTLSVGSSDVAVTGTEDGYLLCWDLRDGRRTRVIPGVHAEGVYDLALEPGGSALALTAGGLNDDPAAVWDLAAGVRLTRFTGLTEVSWMGWAPLGGRPHAVIVADGVLYRWAPGDGEPVEAFPIGAGSVSLIEPLADGRPAVVIGQGTTVRLFDLASGALLGATTAEFNLSINGVALSAPRSSLVVTQGGSSEGLVNVLDLPREVTVPPRFRSVADAVPAMLHGRPVVVTAGDDAHVRTYDAADGGRVGRPACAVRSSYPRLAGATVDDRLVAVVKGDFGQFAVVHVDDGSMREPAEDRPWMAAGPAVAARSFGPDALAVFGDCAGRIVVWDLRTMRIAGRAEHPTSAVLALAGWGDGLVLTGEDDGHVRFWHTGDPDDLVGVIRPHRDAVSHLEVLDAGDRQVVLSACGGTVAQWELTDRVQAGPDLPHPGQVTSLLPATLDGTELAVTACHDRRLRVWDLGTGRCEQEIETPWPVRKVVTADADGLIVHAGGGLVRLAGVLS